MAKAATWHHTDAEARKRGERTGLETRVSNPVCSPRFRVSASVTVQKGAFATGVPPDIYEFHLYTGNSPFLSSTQEKQFPMHFPG